MTVKSNFPVLFSFLEKAHSKGDFEQPFNAEAIFSETEYDNLIQEIGPVANALFEATRDNSKHIAKHCLPVRALFFSYIKKDEPSLGEALSFMVYIHTLCCTGDVREFPVNR